MILRTVLYLILIYNRKLRFHYGDRSTCPTGIDYIEFTPQGVFTGRLSRDSEFLDKTFWAMLRRFAKMINIYAREQKGRNVYWRIKPELDASSTSCFEENCPLQSTAEKQRQHYRDNFDCKPCLLYKKLKPNRYIGYTRLVIA